MTSTFLAHYNHNHDKLGRFARSNGNNATFLKGTSNKNVDRWGKSKNTNVLYITGQSGSGKSTLAKQIANENKNVSVIHLDSYFDNPDGPRDKEFDAFLDKNLPDHRMLSASKDKISLEDWGKLSAKFEAELEKYGEYQHSRGRKVVAEGVQLLDDTLRPDKSFFIDKPVVVAKTSTVKSILRASKRDSVKLTPENVKRYIENASQWNFDRKMFESEAQISNGKSFIDRFSKPNNSHIGNAEKLTNETISKYKKDIPQLSHVRINKNTYGELFTDRSDKPIGMVNTERKSDGYTWIQGIEVFGDNKGKGYGRKMLDLAVTEYGATRLSVNKNNHVAKNLYDDYGFKVYDEDENMYYMKYGRKG